MTKAEQAKQNFLAGCNCCQAVLLAFAEDLGIDKKTALMLASPFGGGMGRMREVCGAVSGMFMVAGLKHGYTDLSDKAAKAEHYALIQRLAEEYKKENGSIVCKELLGLSKKMDNPVPADRTEGYYKKRPCPDLVYHAAQIAEELL